MNFISEQGFWIALIGIITGCLTLWTFYKDFWEGPSISLTVGDQFDIVKSTDKTTNKLHLDCTFVNSSRKTGIITQVVVFVEKKGQDDKYTFQWGIFYTYEHGHKSVPTSRICPLAVHGNSSILQGIEFYSNKPIIWEIGEYAIKVSCWLEGRKKIVDTFSAAITDEDSRILNENVKPANPLLHKVFISGRTLKTGLN